MCLLAVGPVFRYLIPDSDAACVRIHFSVCITCHSRSEWKIEKKNSLVQCKQTELLSAALFKQGVERPFAANLPHLSLPVHSFAIMDVFESQTRLLVLGLVTTNRQAQPLQ